MKSVWLLLAVIVGVAQAGIYKCKVDGVTVYQSSPCEGGKEMVMKSAAPAPVPESQKTWPQNEMVDNVSKATAYTRSSEKHYLIQREIDKKDREIKKHRKNIKHYQHKMRSELVVLKRKKGYANNNLAGATWEQSISTEMEAVTAKYRQMIDGENGEIVQLRDEIKELKVELK